MFFSLGPSVKPALTSTTVVEYGGDEEKNDGENPEGSCLFVCLIRHYLEIPISGYLTHVFSRVGLLQSHILEWKGDLDVFTLNSNFAASLPY